MASVKSEQSAAAKAGAVKDEAYNGPKPKFQPNIAHSSPWGTTLGAQLDDSDFHVERKPGQKQPTPSPGTGERVFYETLLKEKPNSYIALKWAVEHGIFPVEECEAKIAILDNLKEKEKERVSRLVAESAAARQSSASSRKRDRSNNSDGDEDDEDDYE